jgi:hypothetical protein
VGCGSIDHASSPRRRDSFLGLRNADWQMIRTEKEKGWPEFNQGQPLDG